MNFSKAVASTILEGDRREGPIPNNGDQSQLSAKRGLSTEKKWKRGLSNEMVASAKWKEEVDSSSKIPNPKEDKMMVEA